MHRTIIACFLVIFSFSTLCHADTAEIKLNAGWNLVSLPLKPDIPDIESVLAPVSDVTLSVWSYSDGRWQVYDFNNENLFNDLDSMEEGKGYWINMIESAVLPLTGTAANGTIKVNSGWNLIGYIKGLEPGFISPEISDSIWTYDDGKWSVYDANNVTMSDLDTLTPGLGYWVKSKIPYEQEVNSQDIASFYADAETKYPASGTSHTEIMSMCLTGGLLPSDELSQRLADDLALIDSEYSIEAAFIAPWEPGVILVGFDDATAEKILNSEYNEWDVLNEKYSIEIEHVNYGYAVLRSRAAFNPKVLSKEYLKLPGARYCDPNGRIGDSQNIYPRIIGDKITYLFYSGQGDCMAGCISKSYEYYEVENGSVTFIGEWSNEDNTDKPEWWSEAEKNISLYYTF